MNAAARGPGLNIRDPRVNPHAIEIRGDGIDQECNGCELAIRGARDGEILPRRN